MVRVIKEYDGEELTAAIGFVLVEDVVQQGVAGGLAHVRQVGVPNTHPHTHTQAKRTFC